MMTTTTLHASSLVSTHVARKSSLQFQSMSVDGDDGKTVQLLQAAFFSTLTSLCYDLQGSLGVINQYHILTPLASVSEVGVRIHLKALSTKDKK